MDNKNELKTIPTCYFTDGISLVLVVGSRPLVGFIPGFYEVWQGVYGLGFLPGQ